jgi:hypothetical protein
VRRKAVWPAPSSQTSTLTGLERFVEQSVLPEYNHCDRRQRNRAYQTVQYAIQRARHHRHRDAVRTLQQQLRTLPSQDPHDPHYRRLRYLRYADDWLLGFAGPKHEAEQIKSMIAAFLHHELKLELSQPKMLITHATSQAARFLGYEIMGPTRRSPGVVNGLGKWRSLVEFIWREHWSNYWAYPTLLAPVLAAQSTTGPTNGPGRLPCYAS